MQLSLVRMWSTLKEFTNIDLNSEFQNIRQWWNDHDSGIRSWNNVVTNSLTIKGASGTITNWVNYTPTFGGFGTTANVFFKWKQIGDTVYVSGIFSSGTNAGVTASISLPNNFTILYGTNAMSVKQDIIGLWGQSRTENIFSNNDAGFMITDGSTTTKVFFAIAGFTGGQFVSANDSAIATSGNYMQVNFWFIHA